MGKGMAWTSRVALLLIFLFLAQYSTLICADKEDYTHCEGIVRKWGDTSRETVVKEDSLTLKDLLFFLHIPRTGGRTYFHCFLRKLYTSDQECPRSYDKLRFDPSKPKCRLMVTHDDYSLMSKLPRDETSVVTILRSPVDRVFSTYEFSVEVAARFLIHPNLTSATQMSRRLRPKSRGVSTLDIWPWKYLVPWMREDLFARRDARKLGRLQRTKAASNPYDMEDMVMPLQEFIDDPVSHEIIHNGATFQVAGLTNNSYTANSHEVRSCIRKHPELGHIVLEIAKDRLDQMLYVGLTEEHKKSATMFAEMVGAQILSQSEALGSVAEDGSEKAGNYSDPNFFDSEADGSNHNQLNITNRETNEVSPSTNNSTETGNMTIETLMEAYEVCISSLRKSQSSRRTMSLKRIAPANFSKEARLSVPQDILQQILTLNHLDVELYKHARHIFMQQQNHRMRDSMQKQGNNNAKVVADGIGSTSIRGGSPLTVFLVAATLLVFFVVVLVVLLIVTTRRRTSKIKI